MREEAEACSRSIWLQLFPAEVVFHQPLEQLCPLFSRRIQEELCQLGAAPLVLSSVKSSGFTSTVHSQAPPKIQIAEEFPPSRRHTSRFPPPQTSEVRPASPRNTLEILLLPFQNVCFIERIQLKHLCSAGGALETLTL